MFSFFDQTELETLSRMSDEELLRASIQHPHVFTELIKRYQDAFLRKAQSVLYSEEDAQDVVQETFMKIYQYAGRFERVEGASFKSWGYKILMNTTFTRYQKLKRDRLAIAPFEMEFYELLPDTDMEQFADKELRDYVTSILLKLPDQMARVLRMYFLEKKAQKEIAEIEGTSVGAIKTRMHRAKIEFRNVLKAISSTTS